MQNSQQYSNNFNELLRDLEQFPLVLFIGAGINVPIVPMWKDLLKCLLEVTADKIIDASGGRYEIREQLIEQLGEFSDYEQASLAKLLLGKKYFIYLRSQLYHFYKSGSQFSWEKLEKNNANYLQNVVKLCENQKVQAVVSYNYDDILLTAINSRKKRIAYSVCGEILGKPPTEKDLPIYYVHGFIPCEGRLPPVKEHRVVLSQDEYFRIMLEPYSWQTTVQLHFLQNYVALFLGTSLNDWNMMRMLSTAHAYSPSRSAYYITTPYPVASDSEDNSEAQGQGLPQIIPRVRSTLFHDIGIKPIFTKENKYSAIHDLVSTLTKELDRKTKRKHYE